MKNIKSQIILQNTKFLFCFMVLIFGFLLSLIDDSILNNGILGIGVFLSGYQLMNLIKQ